MTRVCNMLESARGAFWSIMLQYWIAYVRVIRACLPDFNKKKAKLVCWLLLARFKYFNILQSFGVKFDLRSVEDWKVFSGKKV